MDELVVTDDNFMILAARNYDGNSLMTRDFYDDIKRVKYLKRIFNRYKKKEEIKFRLTLNHLVVFYNVFGPDLATKILFLKLEEYLPMLKPFLEQLGYWPVNKEIRVGKSIINTSTVKTDLWIEKALKEEILNGTGFSDE